MRKIPCRNITQTGYCKFGDQCRFYHPPNTINNTSNIDNSNTSNNTDSTSNIGNIDNIGNLNYNQNLDSNINTNTNTNLELEVNLELEEDINYLNNINIVNNEILLIEFPDYPFTSFKLSVEPMNEASYEEMRLANLLLNQNNRRQAQINQNNQDQRYQINQYDQRYDSNYNLNYSNIGLGSREFTITYNEFFKKNLEVLQKTIYHYNQQYHQNINTTNTSNNTITTNTSNTITNINTNNNITNTTNTNINNNLDKNISISRKLLLKNCNGFILDCSRMNSYKQAYMMFSHNNKKFYSMTSPPIVNYINNTNTINTSISNLNTNYNNLDTTSNYNNNNNNLNNLDSNIKDINNKNNNKNINDNIKNEFSIDSLKNLGTKEFEDVEGVPSYENGSIPYDITKKN